MSVHVQYYFQLKMNQNSEPIYDIYETNKHNNEPDIITANSTLIMTHKILDEENNHLQTNSEAI